MNEPKALKWVYDRARWRVAIGGGFIRLEVYQTAWTRWAAKIIGVVEMEQPERFDTKEEAMLHAEHRASVYVRQMAEELQASFMSAESEASDG